jgi:MFS superfamily sulfate permease-like transporter
MTLTAVLLGLLAGLAFFVVSTGVVMFLIIKLPANHFCNRGCPERRPDAHPARRWAVWIVKNLAGVLVVFTGIVLALPGVPGPGLVLVLLGIAMVDFPGKHRLERKIVGRPGVVRTLNSFRARFGKPPLLFEIRSPGPAEETEAQSERK